MLETEDDHTLQAAHALRRSGRLSEAADLYRGLVSKNSDNFHALHFLGVTEAGTGNFAQAKLLMARSLSIEPPNIQFVENYATILFQAADYKSAFDCCARGLALNPGSSTLLYVGALALLKLGRFRESLARFDELIRLQPQHIAALNERAAALAELDQYDAALASIAAALRLDPRYVPAHLNRAVLHVRQRRYDEAIAAYDEALALDPKLAEAWLGRGNVSRELGRRDEALAAYDRALALKGGLAGAWLGRGNVFCELGRYDDALAAYDRALALNDALAAAWLGRGNVFCERGRHQESIAAHDQALALAPDLAEAWLGRGNALDQVRRFAESLAAYDRALALKPDLAKAWLGRGNAYCEFQRYDESLAAYDRALALKPDLAQAWFGRSTTLSKTGRYDEALAAHDRALALKPDLAAAWFGRAVALLESNRDADALADIDKALALKPDFRQALSYRIFVLDFASGVGIEEQQQARTRWWRVAGAELAGSAPARHDNGRDPDRRVRLGYVSADFRSHSAALFFKPILLHHDKARFEVTCYSCSNLEDDTTNDFRRAADRWRSVASLSDDELDAQIRADHIDILVDLSGHSAGHRLEVFARKPAPVAVSAGGTGTGVPAIDYLFSDPVICPAEARHLFAEKIVDLPCVITIAPLPEQLPPSDPPVLANGHVTFGVFNRATKISDNVVSLWARILHAVPRSRLLLKHYAFDHAALRGRLTEKFASHGIAADRVGFRGSTSRAEHLAAFKDVDISFDPFPHNGGISTWESLQMGVPVVALLGRTIASRAAGAILFSVGMTDWVADSAEEYLAIAAKFAAAPGDLKALRHELPARLSASAAGNSALYTKAVEAAYRTMWADFCRTAA